MSGVTLESESSGDLSYTQLVHYACENSPNLVPWVLHGGHPLPMNHPIASQGPIFVSMLMAGNSRVE